MLGVSFDGRGKLTEAPTLERLLATELKEEEAPAPTDEAWLEAPAAADEALPEAPAAPKMVVEPYVVVKVELPETPVLTRAEVVTADEEAPVGDPPAPPAPPIPKIVVEPIVDPPEITAEVAMAEEEAAGVVAPAAFYSCVSH